MNLKNLEKKRDEEIQAKKTEINNMAIGKKKLIAEFEETKTLTAGMKESVHRFWHVSQGRPGISQFIHFMISDAHFLLFIEQLQGWNWKCSC